MTSEQRLAAAEAALEEILQSTDRLALAMDTVPTTSVHALVRNIIRGCWADRSVS